MKHPFDQEAVNAARKVRLAGITYQSSNATEEILQAAWDSMESRGQFSSERFGVNFQSLLFSSKAQVFFQLTNIEWHIFCLLYFRSVMSIDQIINAVWGSDKDSANSNNFRIHIWNINQKLKQYQIQIRTPTYSLRHFSPADKETIKSLLKTKDLLNA